MQSEINKIPPHHKPIKVLQTPENFRIQRALFHTFPQELPILGVYYTNFFRVQFITLFWT